MPRDVRQFTLVISAPGDMASDVAQVEGIVRALNHALDLRNVVVRTRHWSHSATPGIGTEGQEVVRRQLLEECDILVALIGKRLGTPTTEHESGTVDEIMSMCRRDGSMFSGHHVQVYFKNEAVPMEERALADAARVIAFKKRAEDSGIFYGTYQSSDDLSAALLPNIQRAIEVYMRGDAEKDIMTPNPRQDPETLAEHASGMGDPRLEQEPADEPEILDLVVAFHAKFMRVASRIQVFSGEVSALTVVVAESMPVLEFESDPAKKRDAVNHLADRMSLAAARITDAVEGGEDELQVAIQEMISAIYKQISYGPSSDVTDKTIAEMIEEMLQATTHIDDLQASIAKNRQLDNLPDLTSKLRRGKRVLATAFESFGDFLAKTRGIILEGQIEIVKVIALNRPGTA